MAKKILFVSLIFLLTISSWARLPTMPQPRAQRSLDSRVEKPKMNSKLIIIDTDAGLDDAWAIFLLLQAHQLSNSTIKIVGITSTAGNTRVGNVTENAARVLETMAELNIPLYRGSEAALVRPLRDDEMTYFGQDGFGDAGLPPIEPNVQPSHGAIGLLELAQQYKDQGKVSILALGPLTNLATAYRLNPTVMKEDVKEIYFLGGNYAGMGNMGVATEFNVYGDVEAAAIVLDNFYPVPIIVFPWETCLAGILDYSFRVDTLGVMETKEMELLNKIEATFLSEHTDGWLPSDTLPAAMLLDSTIATKIESYWAGVEMKGALTRGMMVVDRGFILGKTPNVQIVMDVNIDLYKKMLIWAAGGPIYTS